MNGAFYDKQRRGGVSVTSMLLLCVLLAVPTIALLRLAHTVEARFLFAYLFFVSLITYFLYRHDKAKAERGEWRIPEVTLHILEFFGGWAAAYLAQRNFRHKTSKVSYQATFLAIIFLHEVLSLDYLRDWKVLKQVMTIIQQ